MKGKPFWNKLNQLPTAAAELPKCDFLLKSYYLPFLKQVFSVLCTWVGGCHLLEKSFIHQSGYNVICLWLSEPMLRPHMCTYHFLLDHKGLLGASFILSLIAVTLRGV